jgi:sugar phosphate isomerase/epimerase
MKIQDISRRQFIGASAATVAGLVIGTKSVIGAPAIIKNLGKPNSMFKGVQVGTITYSFRSMPDQSAESILKYCVDANVSAIELMGPVAETFAGAPSQPQRAGAPAGGPPLAAPGGAGAPPPAGAAPGGGQRGGQRAPLTPEQEAAAAEARKKTADWRTSVSMDKFEQLRKMYKDAGVTIYAWKPSTFSAQNTDAEIDYAFRAAKALGASHCTVELPTDPAQSLRLGKLAEKNKMFIAYHTHQQGSITAFDTAFGQSPNNRSNVDIGHYTAVPTNGSPIEFLKKFNDKIASIHLKDRTKDQGNLVWGTGETPIVEALQLIRDQKYKFPASCELEYQIPEGSDAVKETAKCIEYAKKALEA